LVVSSAGKGFWNPEAAALPLTTITAWETFFERLHIDRAGADAGKLLLIIGGAGGVGSIGIQIAKFAGLKVIATASRRETREWCRNLGADYVIDHRQPLKTELEKIGIGQVDYIVNFSNTDLFEKISDNDWSKLIETNFMSGVRLSRFYLPLMKKQDWGRIIFISSESGVNIPSNMIHYGVTKTMQIALARGLAETTAGTAVTVNSIVVGPTSTEGVNKFLANLAKKTNVSIAEIQTNFFKTERPGSLLQRFAKAEEVANLVLYYSSPLSSGTNGAAIRVDGGVVRSIL